MIQKQIKQKKIKEKMKQIQIKQKKIKEKMKQI